MPSRQIPKLYIPSDSTEAAIRAVHAAAVAAGGGIILLPDAVIMLTEPLPVASGIGYQGVQPVLNYLNDTLPDSGWDFVGGTVLAGDGSFPAFAANDADLGSPPATITANCITGWRCEHIGFTGFTRAISIGAVNNIGLQFSTIHDLFIRDCSDWGIFLANFMHTDVSRVWTHLCENGQYYASLLPGSTLMPGNSRFDSLFNIIPADGRDNRLCRGIVFEAGGDGARLNEMYADRIQNNAFNRTELVASATFSDGSANIAVAEGSKFRARMPVAFTGGDYGIAAGRVHVVKSVSGNTIQIGKAFTSPAMIASGSGSLMLSSWGMPCFELSSRDEGAFVSNSRLLGVDAEGGAGAGIYVENAQGCDLNISEVSGDGNADIVGRRVGFSRFYSSNTTVTDFDAVSATSQFHGARGVGRQAMLSGLWTDQTRGGLAAFNIRGDAWENQGDLEVRGGNSFIYPRFGMGMKSTLKTANTVLHPLDAGLVTFDAASALVCTLPEITNSSDASSLVGLPFHIVNAGSADLTVNTNGTQLFNRISGKTGYTLNAGESLLVVASEGAGSTLFWAAFPSVGVA
ncbi:Hypothetical protein NGAL_HAMBI2605_22380 [Neorhizobium galegae bv. orientalis]|nr:Hypothetical protein NGAL_HAMBI2605_22380 [Neorhizobium galegae bv. orientalis]